MHTYIMMLTHCIIVKGNKSKLIIMFNTSDFNLYFLYFSFFFQFLWEKGFIAKLTTMVINFLTLNVIKEWFIIRLL